MFKNYFRIAIRKMRNNKAHSFINIAGLSVGMAVAILIGLTKYSYHTSIAWWIFAVAGIGTLLITMLTVSYQCIKAALNNPVKSLRSE